MINLKGIPEWDRRTENRAIYKTDNEVLAITQKRKNGKIDLYSKPLKIYGYYLTLRGKKFNNINDVMNYVSEFINMK